MAAVSTRSIGGIAARVFPDPEHSQTYALNAAFLQEIKDSNPPLWHRCHDIRALCQLDCGAGRLDANADDVDANSPQVTIKCFVDGLDDLRDLLALQFTLEESYGFLATPKANSAGIDETDESLGSFQSDVRRALADHRLLYLQLVDLVEQSEELQYRGCDQACLRRFAEQVEEYLRRLTAHERLESDLIRLVQPQSLTR